MNGLLKSWTIGRDAQAYIATTLARRYIQNLYFFLNSAYIGIITVIEHNIHLWYYNKWTYST